MTKRILLLALFLPLAQLTYSSNTIEEETVIDGNSFSSLCFNMDSCSAWILAGTRNDYTEFVAQASSDDDCSEMSVLNGHLYRVNPTVNFHSCTPGVNGTPAVCISSDDACQFNPSNEKALRMDIVVSPGANGSATLSNISFYERAPEEFVFLDGPTGTNNYPTLFGIRILRDSQEVFFIEDVSTNFDYTLQTFDLGTNPLLTVTEPTVFNIEMMAYCLIGNGEGVTAWDLDDLKITAACADASVDGGILTTGNGETELSICAQDGQADLVDVLISGYTGTSSAWIITDAGGTIIDIPTSTPIDFEGASGQLCRLWHVSYEGPIFGIEIGNTVNDITGCYGISNSITIFKTNVHGGVLTTTTGDTNVSICVGDGIPDIIDVSLTGATGATNVWVITDQMGNILDLPVSPPFDFENASIGVCQIWNLSYDGVINGLSIGNNVTQLTGCYALSSTITVNRSVLDGALLTLTSGAMDTLVCVADGMDDWIDVVYTGPTGPNSAWLITDEDLNILEIPLTPPFNFENAVPGTCLIWKLNYDNITGINVGANAADLAGCFGLSNSITVRREASNGGFISYDGQVYIEICEDDGQSNILDMDQINQIGDNTIWVVTDANGVIIEISASASIEFDSKPSGTYSIYNIMYNSSINGLNLDETIGNVNGDCLSISNSVTVVKEIAIGGSITTADGDDIMLCITDGNADPIEIDLSGNEGQFSTWLILDANGNILDIPVSTPITPSYSNDECFVRHLSYGPSFAGLALNQNIAGFSGCYDLSNQIRIGKDSISGGYLTSEGETFVFFCSLIGEESMIDYELINTAGSNQDLILTDESGVILEYINGNVIDLNSYPNGTYFVVNLAYNQAVNNNIIGANVNDIDGACFDMSNTLEILKKAIDGGVLGSSLGTDIFLCRNGENASYEEVDVSVTNTVGTHTALIVTDEDGFILDLPLDIPLNMDAVGVNPCFIWHISYEVGLTGKEIGNHLSDIEGCYDLSNSIKINKQTQEAGEINSSGQTTLEFCVGDDIPDVVNVQVINETGDNFTWIITDENGIILDLPANSFFDFEDAGGGVCMIYYAAYLTGTIGIEIGSDITAIDGCFDVSNAITVIRNEVKASEITFNDGTTEKMVCVGDDENDFLQVVSIVSGIGTSRILVTDTNGNILDISSTKTLNFENAGPGTCLIWEIHYNEIQGMGIGENASN